ncbi:MAG: ABC transporter ATP-binding protein [Nitrososphaerales archaeon]
MDSSSPSPNSILEVSHLRKNFGKFYAVDDVTFSIAKGSRVLLLGPNGAGKSTIIKCVMGLLNFSGQIYADGVDAHKDSEEARKRIGYIPQQMAYYDNLSVYDQTLFICKLKKANTTKIEENLKKVNLWEHRKKKVRSLSQGMKQRLGIAIALLSEPPLLIFDEPTVNVDLKGQLDFQATAERLASEGKTVLDVTHYPGFGDFANDAIVMNKGKIVAHGTPAELMKEVRSRDAIYVKLDALANGGAIKLMEDAGAENVGMDGEWIVGYISPSNKVRVIGSLIKSNYVVQDLVIEPANIDSEYFKLFEQK